MAATGPTAANDGAGASSAPRSKARRRSTLLKTRALHSASTEPVALAEVLADCQAMIELQARKSGIRLEALDHAQARIPDLKETS
ncbi:MAG: hypothetical protein ABI434_09360 [Burkholderiaceae bacterium]